MESLLRSAILFSCVSSILAGCRHENSSSNYRSLWISSDAGVLHFSSESKNTTDLATHLSFSFSSLSEKDELENEISSHFVCYHCDSKTLTDEQWLSDPGFQTCINEATATAVSSTSFSVQIENWEWCDYCGHAEANQTQKGSYLDVILIAESFIATEMMALMEEDHHISFGDYRIKFSNLYTTEEGEDHVMPNGFPSIIQMGLKTSITLRLQRQKSLDTFIYQPLIVKQQAPQLSPTPVDSTGAHDSHLSSLIITIAIFTIIGVPFSFWCYSRFLEKAPDEKLFPPMTSGMKNHYASLDDSEVFGYELEHVELQQGAREIELPETEGEDCLSDSRGDDEPEPQNERDRDSMVYQLQEAPWLG